METRNILASSTAESQDTLSDVGRTAWNPTHPRYRRQGRMANYAFCFGENNGDAILHWLSERIAGWKDPQRPGREPTRSG